MLPIGGEPFIDWNFSSIRTTFDVKKLGWFLDLTAGRGGGVPFRLAGVFGVCSPCSVFGRPHAESEAVGDDADGAEGHGGAGQNGAE